MTLKEILQISNGVIVNKKYKIKEMNMLSVDTRTIQKNDFYVALKGKVYDGHNFIKEAIEKKCSLIIIDDESYIIDNKIPIIKVNNTYDFLIEYGKYMRDKFNQIPLIGITGSVGKTTTKDLISYILEAKYKVLKNEGSKNNHIGIPLTLSKINDKVEVIVTEIGMNHSNEISNLSKMCKPNIGVITNIGTSHIGNLKNKKNILKAKLEIVDGMENGKLIVNKSDKHLRRIHLKNVEVIKTDKKHLKIFNIKSTIRNTKFKMIYKNKIYNFEYQFPGIHFIDDIALAIEIALMFDIDINDIVDRIKTFTITSRRMNVIPFDNFLLIDDAYNACYESMTGLFKIVANDSRKKIFILGDILELGKQSKKIHKKIINYLKKIPNKEVLLVGESMKKASKNTNFKSFNNIDELYNFFKTIDLENVIVAIKGSHANKLDIIVDKIKIDYNIKKI